MGSDPAKQNPGSSFLGRTGVHLLLFGHFSPNDTAPTINLESRTGIVPRVSFDFLRSLCELLLQILIDRSKEVLGI